MQNQGRCYELFSPVPVLIGQRTSTPIENIYLDSGYRTENEEQVTMNGEENLVLTNAVQEVPLRYQFQPLEEDFLSQKLSQLTTNLHQSKEHLYTFDEDMNEDMPYYLSKESESFKQVISHISSNDFIEELRQLAFLIHQISIINLEKSLWITYLKAGTGKLEINPIDYDYEMNSPSIWPVEVLQSMKKQSLHSTDHSICLVYVTEYLCELDKKMEQYQMKLNVKKEQISNYQQMIETFVRQRLEPVRVETELQMALVQYTYIDRALELQYLPHHRSQNQKEIIQQLTHAKFQEEITKEEYNFLKHRISIHKSSPIRFDLAQETFFTTIEDQYIRQKFHDQYIKVAQQAKEDMIQLYLSSAKTQMDRCRQQFNSKLKQFWQEQHSLSNDQKLTPSVIVILEKRWKNINEAVKWVYKYKLDLLHLKCILE